MTDTISSLAQKLRPYWLRDATGGGGVVSGGGGAMSAHALNGPYHTGTLDEAQAPWAVTDSEFAAHAANPDAHHARQHSIISGSDHTATGSKWQIVGLTAVNTLGLLTPIQNPGAAEAILKTDANGAVQVVSLEATSALYATGLLDFGTDYIQEDATYLRVYGAKPLRFDQTIQSGANPSPAWSMTPAGSLAAATGAFAEGLTAAAAAFRVYNHTHDYPHAHVVINPGPLWNLDEQFGLDVDDNLLVRGWIVGKHAIQLPGAKAIFHYDGPQPFETNFRGTLTGHMGQPAFVSGGVVFRHGKFGKALQISNAITNLVTNPSFETGTTGWVWNDANASGATPAITNSYGYYHSGAASLRLSNTVAGENDYMSFNVTGLAASTSYTISAWCRVVSFSGAAVGSRGLTAYDVADTATLQTTAIASLVEEWTRHVVTVNTTAAGGSHTIQIRLYAPQGYVLWDAVQCEARSYATPYLDGSLGGYSAAGAADGSGHAWSGTAHASTSSRVAGQMYYATADAIEAASGTIMAWVNTTALTPTNQTILRANGSAGYIILRLDSSGRPNAWAGTTGITASSGVAVGEWVHLAMAYNASTVWIYVNGALVASGASSGFAGMPAAFYVGCNGTAEQFNGLIDDLVIADRVVAADEIRAIYESNAPVFGETSTWHWRAGRNRFSADAEGIWMVNAAGQPMFGAYAGDDLNPAATKTWGGVALASSDVLIGDANRGGYVLWDDSAGTMVFKGAGPDLTQINGGNITTGSITATQIATGTITATQIAADTITAAQIAANAVTATEIAAGAVTATKINVTNLAAVNVSTGALSISDILSIAGSGEIRQVINDPGVGFSGPGGYTGLRIWNDGNVGRIGSYKSGLLQWYNDTSGAMFFGANAGRLAANGMSLTLPDVSAGVSVPTNTSAIRWLYPANNSTWDASKSYTGLVSYRYTVGASKFVDNLYTAFVGADDAATYDARFILQAGHQTNASDIGTYSDTRLEIVREKGAGGKFVAVYCDTFTASNNVYVTGNMSAASITDRTPHYDGDALADLRGVRGSKKGGIDHASLPAFARRQVARVDGSMEEGRDLGAMISILTAAVGQLDARLAALEGKR